MSRISPRPDSPLIYEFSEAGERDSRTLVTLECRFFSPHSSMISQKERSPDKRQQVLVSEKGSAAFKLSHYFYPKKNSGNRG